MSSPPVRTLPAVRRKGHGVNFAGVSLEPAHQFPVRDAQDVSRFFSRGKDGFPVGGKRHRHPLARQIVEALQFPTGLDVPEAERSPDSSRQDRLAVRGEGGTVDAARLFQAMQLRAAVHVPQERDIIPAAREGDPAVVGDGDVPDLLGVSRERADFMAVLQVPRGAPSCRRPRKWPAARPGGRRRHALCPLACRNPAPPRRWPRPTGEWRCHSSR